MCAVHQSCVLLALGIVEPPSQLTTMPALQGKLLRVYDLSHSLVPYAAALALQEGLVQRRKTGVGEDTLVLLQVQNKGLTANESAEYQGRQFARYDGEHKLCSSAQTVSVSHWLGLYVCIPIQLETD